MQTLKRRNYEAYLATDLRNLTGEWVVFSDGELVAHDKDLKKAVNKAKQVSGEKRLMLAKVPEKETMIYAA